MIRWIINILIKTIFIFEKPVALTAIEVFNRFLVFLKNIKAAQNPFTSINIAGEYIKGMIIRITIARNQILGTTVKIKPKKKNNKR